MIESPRRRLHIATHREEEFVRVSVEDTGTGLDEAVAARLFQPFITSICRTIVEAHRGRIWFESRPAGGTVFHFTLPVAD